jgi:hypothetical protein
MWGWAAISSLAASLLLSQRSTLAVLEDAYLHKYLTNKDYYDMLALL